MRNNRWGLVQVTCLCLNNAPPHHRYNLLREDSEGYAKLIAALNQHGSSALNEASIPALLKEITALVGFFDLDPNRVLDLVLEAFERQPDNTAYLKLIPYFNQEAVVHLLGFKFQQCQVRLWDAGLDLGSSNAW